MADQNLRYGLFTPDQELGRTVRSALQALEPGARATASARQNTDDVDFSTSSVPEVDLVFLEMGSSLSCSLDAMRVLQDRESPPHVIMAGPALPADALLQIMRAGVSEYLPRPLGESEIRDAIKRRFVRMGRLGPRRANNGRLIAVFGTTGGAGVTTMALNLALELRGVTEDPTLFLDMALPGGSAEALLDIVPKYTLSDLIKNFHRFDESLLKSYVTQSGRGVELLCAPRSALNGERGTADQVRTVVEAVRPFYRFAVVDVGVGSNPRALSVLREADEMILVLNPTVACLRSTRRYLPLLEQLVPGMRSRLHPVLNLFDPDIPIGAAEVSDTLGLDVQVVLDRDDSMMRRDAAGAGVAAIRGSSDFSRTIQSLAAELAGLDPSGSSTRGIRAAAGALFRRILPTRKSPAGRSQPNPMPQVNR